MTAPVLAPPAVPDLARARRPVVPRPRRAALTPYVPPPVLAPAPAAPEPRVAFRPDVEGLRGLAVLLVVLYHGGLPWLPGGFVGVDTFFVVSGYVITSLLVAEVRQGGGVGLVAFYARRCRRILPAAGFVLAATCAAGAVLLPPLARLDLARDVVASAFYGANWHFIAEQTDYLRSGGDPSPVLHYWSLGVEEQFYLLWPVAFVAALAVARRLRIGRTTALAVVLTALTAASFAASLRWTTTSAPLAYLSSPSRAWQFAVGAWLALLLPVAARLRGRLAGAVRVVLGVVGLAALGWSAASVDDAHYPGTAALVPTMAAAAVLAAGCDLPDAPARGVTRLLSSGLPRRLGVWSFTWYLWHWPAVVLVAARWGDVTWSVRLAVAVGALLPAALTTRWLERPLRRSPVVGSRPRVGIALGVVATTVPVVAATLLTTSATDDLGGGVAGTTAVTVAFDDTRTSGAVVPTPVAARTDFPTGGQAGCLALDGAKTNPACRIGRISDAGPVVLFGDSHADQWLPAVVRLARARGTGVLQLTKAGCPAPDIKVDEAGGPAALAECDRWRENTWRRLESGPRPALVVVSSFLGYSDRTAFKAQQWRSTLERLGRLGVPVLYVADNPEPGLDVPACVSGALDDWSRCVFPWNTARRPDPTAESVREGRFPGVYLVDLTAQICPPVAGAGRCPAVRGGVLLYRDNTHLTDTAVRTLAPAFVTAALHELP